MLPNTFNQCGHNICIFTLGKFFFQDDNVQISENTSRSKRMWEIFKFLLSNRGKAFFPETILDKIWPDNNYSEPALAMRVQIHRLRQALNSGSTRPSLAENIIFDQGCYSWEDRVPYWLDINEFEALVDEAEKIIASDPAGAIALYRKVIAIYKGKYLPELSFSEWLEPVRSYYHDLYLGAIYNMIDLLKAGGAYKEIVQVCEKAVAVDYYDEAIHIKMIEALLAENLHNRARVHYNEVTSTFYRELGIKPSEPLKNLYRLVGVEPSDFELDLSTIQDGLKGKEAVNGAYLCDAELFRYFYQLERLRVERNGQSVLLGLLTLTAPDYQAPDKQNLKAVMHNLEKVVLDSLRKGDLVTRWNEAQFLLLLPSLNREQAEKVIARIENNFHRQYSLQGLILHKKIESIVPLEIDAHFI